MIKIPVELELVKKLVQTGSKDIYYDESVAGVGDNAPSQEAKDVEEHQAALWLLEMRLKEVWDGTV